MFDTLRTRAKQTDLALYRAGSRPLPISPAINTLTNAANHSKISMVWAAALTLSGPRGRRAALAGMASVATASLFANAVAKPVAHRRRPLRADDHHAAPPGEVPVNMPTSTSMPSGHTASAVAFAVGVGQQWPAMGTAAGAVAALVGFSRVHAGVHYPGDVAIGALIGAGCGAAAGPLAVRLVDRSRFAHLITP